MADQEIRRRKTSDPEMDAIMVISQAFADLDRAAINRVLKWAEDRYVRIPHLMPAEATEALTNFTNGIQEVARRLASNPRDVLIAMEKVTAEMEPATGKEPADA